MTRSEAAPALTRQEAAMQANRLRLYDRLPDALARVVWRTVANPAAGRETDGSGPTSWAPQECKDHYNSPETQQWRAAPTLACRQEVM